jgi:DNA-binding NarL/FixJ family response regulator
MRCLIVDDSASFLRAAIAMLGAAGIQVVATATNTDEAVECTVRLQPDLVLLDIDLGAESGFDAAEALTRSAAPPPALILTSTHSESDFADLIDASPALGFLPKFSLSVAAIRRLVGTDRTAPAR